MVIDSTSSTCQINQQDDYRCMCVVCVRCMCTVCACCSFRFFVFFSQLDSIRFDSIWNRISTCQLPTAVPNSIQMRAQTDKGEREREQHTTSRTNNERPVMCLSYPITHTPLSCCCVTRVWCVWLMVGLVGDWILLLGGVGDSLNPVHTQRNRIGNRIKLTTNKHKTDRYSGKTHK